jgi:hypothetical protein
LWIRHQTTAITDTGSCVTWEGAIMGFPSPASDYVEQQLSPVVLCNIGADSRVLETDIGFAVIEPCVKPAKGMYF